MHRSENRTRCRSIHVMQICLTLLGTLRTLYSGGVVISEISIFYQTFQFNIALSPSPPQDFKEDIFDITKKYPQLKM